MTRPMLSAALLAGSLAFMLPASALAQADAAAGWSALKAALADKVTIAEDSVSAAGDRLHAEGVTIKPVGAGAASAMTVAQLDLAVGEPAAGAPIDIRELRLAGLSATGNAEGETSTAERITLIAPGPELVQKLLQGKAAELVGADLDLSQLSAEKIVSTQRNEHGLATVSVEGIEVSQTVDGVAARAVLRGLTADRPAEGPETPPQRLTVANVEAEAVPLSNLLAMMERGPGESMMTTSPRLLRVQGLGLQVDGAQALDVVRFEQVAERDNAGPIPARASLQLEGLALRDHPHLSPELKAFLIARKTPVVEVAGALDYRMNQVTGTLEVEKLELRSPQAADIDLTGKMSGLPDPAAAQSGNPMAAMALTLHALHVQWQDKGLADYLLNTAAQKQGIDRTALVTALLDQKVLNAPDMAPVKAALDRFLRQGGTLEVTANPPQPLPALALMLQPEGLVERLGLSVEAR